ncbi:MAG TPA: endonuclease/exonuclease/phosphatase family protein [Methylomirabilota bacterium]|nr:endonuclease/exonuclease/phosphatase family protein [Methylomirabilota bacterium]
MRIVLWNIRAGGGGRAPAIARQLEAWAPDVVALCEFRATPPSLALAKSLASLGLGHQCTTASHARPGANALLLAARWPLRRCRLSAEPSEPARWLLASVAAPRPLTVGAMHVPNRVSGRKDRFYAAVLAMLGRWRRGPTLLLGDTNSGRRGIDEETAVFGPREEAWLETLERLGWSDAFRLLRGRARAYTWYSPNGRNGFRIDQAFVDEALRSRLRAARYDWGGRAHPHAALSDHAALVLDLDHRR